MTYAMPRTNALIFTPPNFQFVQFIVSVMVAEWDTRRQLSGHGIQVKYHLCHETLDTPES